MVETIKLGGITIQTIVEQTANFFEPRQLFPALTDETLRENLDWLRPGYIDPVSDKLVLWIQSHLVRTGRHTILIDSCVGNHKARPHRKQWNMLRSDAYERNLAAAGVSVDEIDYVMCSHLHPDHVGWNTRMENGRWVPTFPNARYILSARELAFFTERHAADPAAVPWITDSVLPVVAAGKADMVGSDHSISELVHLVPTPGHTIDHYAVRVGKADHSALISGDIFHSPLQLRYPALGIFSEHDATLAAETRRSVLEGLCDTPTLLCPAHFPPPVMGRITSWGEGFRFNGI